MPFVPTYALWTILTPVLVGVGAVLAYLEHLLRR